LYLVFVSVRMLVRWLPLSLARGLGAAVGLIAYGVAGTQRALCTAHLHTALGPSVSAKTCRWVVRGVFMNLGKTAAEWMVIDRYAPARLRRLVDVQGLPHVRRALEKRRGVIALSAHLSNWEVLAMSLASLGFEGGVLARPLRYAEYESFLWTMRQRKGVQTFNRGSLKEIVEALRRNQIIGMMPDQDIDSLEGIFVEFFSRPTFTPVGPAALSLMTGAPIVPCFIVRDGRRFRVMIEEPIEIARCADRAQDLAAITQAWSRVVESYIRRYPAQWVWMHRRWKTQQDSTAPPASTTSAPPPSSIAKRRLTPAVSCLVGAMGMVAASVIGAMPVEAKRADATLPAPTIPVDRTMDSFTVAGYAADGSKRWELEGRGAVAEGKYVTVLGPNAVGYEVNSSPGATASAVSARTPVTRRTYATASLGQVDQVTRRIRLEHEATIHTSDGLWLTSPILYWLPDRNEMVSDYSVRIETDRMLLRGRGAVGQSQLKTARLLHDIEMVVSPSREQVPAAIGPGSSTERRPVTITCDGPLTFDSRRGIAVFERNVRIADGRGTLDTDRLVVYLNPQTHAMTYAEALDHVQIRQDGRVAIAQRAVYEPSLTRITLLGAPALAISSPGAASNGISSINPFGFVKPTPLRSTSAASPSDSGPPPVPSSLAHPTTSTTYP